jgi:hypothetical protein
MVIHQAPLSHWLDRLWPLRVSLHKHWVQRAVLPGVKVTSHAMPELDRMLMLMLMSLMCVQGVVVETLAGSGRSGLSDGVGTCVEFQKPTSVVSYLGGSVVAVDQSNHNIRMISSAGNSCVCL